MATRPRRDPVRTSAKILAAAVQEFGAKGFSGARTGQIARRAKTNIRMLYHYYGGKEALYVSVLEEVLGRLRMEELKLDLADAEPLAGLLTMFDFIDGHFRDHPELLSLLATENLNRARYLKRSARIPEMASPVLDAITGLLARGAAAGTLRADVDALHLYVTLVSLAYYGKSHAYTLSGIFRQDLLADDWQRAQKAQTEAMLSAWLAAPSPASPAGGRPRSR